METTLFGRLAAIAAGRFRDGSTAPPIVRRAPEGDLPLTFFQEARWPRYAGHPADLYFLDGFALALKGPLDEAALDAGLAALYRRHESLRLQVQRDRPAAHLAEPRAVEMPRFDVRDRDADAQRRFACERMLAPLDLARELPFRPQLLRTGDDAHLLLLNYHNLLFNRRSLAALTAEWEQLYRAHVQGAPSPLAEPTIQFTDFVRWQREWLAGDELERRLAPWRERLAGCRPIRLRTDRPRDAAPETCRSTIHEYHLPADLVRATFAFGEKRDCTPFMVLLAAMFALLHHRTGAEEMLLRLITSDLSRATRRMVGMLAGFGHVHVRLSDDPSLETIVGRVRDAVLDALEDQQLPTWGTVPEALRGQSDVLVDPGYTGGPPSWEGLEARHVELPFFENWPARFDFEWLPLLQATDQHFHFLYNADLFAAATMERLGNDYLAMLGELVAHPDRALSAVSGLGAA